MVTLRTFRLPSLAALVLSVLLLATCPRTPVSAVELGPVADVSFLALLNSLRVAKGLKPLAEGGELSSVARSWSSKMATSGTLAHNPALRTEVQGERIGENVGTGGAVQQIFSALVASPPHLRNMYDPLYTRIGVGSVTDGRGVLWTTHVFQTPRSGAVATAPAAAPVASTAPVRRQVSSPAPVRAPIARAGAAPVAAAPMAADPVPPSPSPATPLIPAAPSDGTNPEADAALPRPSEVAAPPIALERQAGRFAFALSALVALGLVLLIAGAAAFVLRRRSGDDRAADSVALPRWYGGRPAPY